MAYEELLSYKLTLALKTEDERFDINEDDPLRKDILRITLTLRRNESSTMSILFDDPNLGWTNFFATTGWIKTYFKGENLDGSAPEEFIGWANQVIPHTDGQHQQIEVIFLDHNPDVARPSKTSKTYKKMSRRAILDKLASDNGSNLVVIEDSYLDKVEDEITHSVNESIAQFMTRMLDEVGLSLNFFHLNWWVVPKFSDATATNIHSNQGADGSLLSMSPKFVPYMFEDPKKSSSGDGEGSQAIDPETSNVEQQGSGNSPDNAPNSDSGGISQMIYDTVNNQWLKKG